MKTYQVHDTAYKIIFVIIFFILSFGPCTILCYDSPMYGNGFGGLDVGGQIIKARLEGAPVADCGDNIYGFVGDTIMFNASGSHVTNGSLTNYTWSFEYNGSVHVIYGNIQFFIFNYSGEYIVNLRVTDSGGLSDNDSLVVTINGTLSSSSVAVIGGVFDILYVDDDNLDGPWNGTERFPYKSIQDGINNSASGDYIRVYSGVYYESINVDFPISLIGNGSKNTTVYGVGSAYALSITSDFVSISNMSIMPGWGCVYGIGVSSDFCEILGNNLSDFGSAGVVISNGAYNIIYNNSISKSDSGIILSYSHHNVIHDNIISGCDGSGIMFAYSYGNNVEANSLYENRYGIMFLSSYYNKVLNNTFNSNEKSHLFVEENIFSGNDYGEGESGKDSGEWFIWVVILVVILLLVVMALFFIYMKNSKTDEGHSEYDTTLYGSSWADFPRISSPTHRSKQYSGRRPKQYSGRRPKQYSGRRPKQGANRCVLKTDDDPYGGRSSASNGIFSGSGPASKESDGGDKLELSGNGLGITSDPASEVSDMDSSVMGGTKVSSGLSPEPSNKGSDIGSSKFSDMGSEEKLLGSLTSFASGAVSKVRDTDLSTRGHRKSRSVISPDSASRFSGTDSSEVENDRKPSSEISSDDDREADESRAYRLSERQTNLRGGVTLESDNKLVNGTRFYKMSNIGRGDYRLPEDYGSDDE